MAWLFGSRADDPCGEGAVAGGREDQVRAGLGNQIVIPSEDYLTLRDPNALYHTDAIDSFSCVRPGLGYVALTTACHHDLRRQGASVLAHARALTSRCELSDRGRLWTCSNGSEAARKLHGSNRVT